MVEFDIMYPNDDQFLQLIPKQRAMVNSYFQDGKLMSYTLNMNRTKLWAVFHVEGESQLIALIDELPLSRYMDYEYEELMFHNSLHMIPSMSMN